MKRMFCCFGMKKNTLTKNVASWQLSTKSTESTSEMSSANDDLLAQIYYVEVEDDDSDGSCWGWFVSFPEEVENSDEGWESDQTT